MDAFQQGLIDLLPRLRRFARALVHDSADADDLVQAAVERALLRRGQWRPDSRLDSWMFTLMKHVWIDETRSRARRGRVFSPPEAGEHIAGESAADIERRLEARDVESALARLPEDQRLAVALVLVEGLSYREAADVLEVPAGTLTSRLVRGRQALLALLGEAAVPGSAQA